LKDSRYRLLQQPKDLLQRGNTTACAQRKVATVTSPEVLPMAVCCCTRRYSGRSSGRWRS